MSARIAAILLAAVVLSGSAEAQTFRISGTVVDERQAPIQGAVVRITGSDTALTTGPSGTFTFGTVVPGRVIVTVAAPTYELRSIPFELTRDTIITVAMRSRVTTLDPMVVRPRLVRIRGTVIDSATRDPILFALVSLYPGGRTTDVSNIGRFTFDTVSTGPVTIVAEAMEHLPVLVQLDARRDTTLTIRLAIDSVAVRMMGVQISRLEQRSQSEPYNVRSFNRDDIARENRSTVGDLVDRMLMASANNSRQRAVMSADEGCVFYDDRKIAPGMLDGMYPELVERVEIYRRGAMIRVYSKRYVMSLGGQAMLRKVFYQVGRGGTVCE